MDHPYGQQSDYQLRDIRTVHGHLPVPTHPITHRFASSCIQNLLEHSGSTKVIGRLQRRGAAVHQEFDVLVCLQTPTAKEGV